MDGHYAHVVGGLQEIGVSHVGDRRRCFLSAGFGICRILALSKKLMSKLEVIVIPDKVLALHGDCIIN